MSDKELLEERAMAELALKEMQLAGFPVFLGNRFELERTWCGHQGVCIGGLHSPNEEFWGPGTCLIHYTVSRWSVYDCDVETFFMHLESALNYMREC